MNANIVTQTENARLKEQIRQLDSALYDNSLVEAELNKQLIVRDELLNKVVEHYMSGRSICGLVFDITELKPKWYNNIPKHGRLCWVGGNEDIMVLITEYNCDMGMFVSSNLDHWCAANPLTNDEIKELMI